MPHRHTIHLKWQPALNPNALHYSTTSCSSDGYRRRLPLRRQLDNITASTFINQSHLPVQSANTLEKTSIQINAHSAVAKFRSPSNGCNGFDVRLTSPLSSDPNPIRSALATIPVTKRVGDFARNSDKLIHELAIANTNNCFAFLPLQSELQNTFENVLEIFQQCARRRAERMIITFFCYSLIPRTADKHTHTHTWRITPAEIYHSVASDNSELCYGCCFVFVSFFIGLWLPWCHIIYRHTLATAFIMHSYSIKTHKHTSKLVWMGKSVHETCSALSFSSMFDGRCTSSRHTHTHPSEVWKRQSVAWV